MGNKLGLTLLVAVITEYTMYCVEYFVCKADAVIHYNGFND